jgi:hypothetical protein
MNTLATFKNWRIQIRPARHWRVNESQFAKIVMDCIRMAAVVAFAALATLLIGT